MGPRGARKRLRGDGQVSPIGDIHVQCNGEDHIVHVSGKLKVVAVNHPWASPKLLAAEAVLAGSEHRGCSVVIARLLGKHPLGDAKLPIWIHRFLENRAGYRMRKKEEERSRAPDLFEKPLPHRHTLLRMKAQRILEVLTFRTTKTNVGHKVHCDETWGQPKVSGTSVKVSKVTKHGKDAFAGLQQVVVVSLNPKMWARAYRICGPVIDGHFVLRITRIWSENDIEVMLVKQSRGYQVVATPHRVRRGGDKMWRIHK